MLPFEFLIFPFSMLPIGMAAAILVYRYCISRITGDVVKIHHEANQWFLDAMIILMF